MRPDRQDTPPRRLFLTILGSKHTYTLDTPTPDQGGPAATITPDEHKKVCNQYSISFLRARVRDAAPNATDVDRLFGPRSRADDRGLLGEFAFDGTTALAAIAHLYDPAAATDGAVTLAEFVASRLGGIPAVGDRTRF